jgi:hypothetical protein
MLPTSIDGFKGRAMLGRSNHTAHISAMRSKSRMYSEMERWRSSSGSGNSSSKPPLTPDHWLAQKASIEESKTQKGLSAVFRTSSASCATTPRVLGDCSRVTGKPEVELRSIRGCDLIRPAWSGEEDGTTKILFGVIGLIRCHCGACDRHCHILLCV